MVFETNYLLHVSIVEIQLPVYFTLQTRSTTVHLPT